MALPFEPASFEDPLEIILAMLAASKRSGREWLSAAALSRELLRDHGIKIPWQTIQALLRSATGLAARRKRDRQWQFSILRKGEERLSNVGPSVIVVDPSKAIEATLNLHRVLGALKGDVRICDPYLDHVTIEHLQACPVGSPIRFLTHTIREEPRVRRLLAAARTEGRSIEIRQVPAAALHDRYLIDDASMTVLGASLNGFGKKQCFVLRAGPEFRTAMAADFERRWSPTPTWS